MPLPDGPFIFVSYSSKDSYFVHPEIKRIEIQGYETWYDKEKLQPGLFWDDQICKAIKACACFIVFITQNAIDSNNVLDEMDQALKAGKPFICINWEKVELPPRFQEPVRNIQALDRYSLHKCEYEEPLSRALSEYIKRREISPKENNDRHVEAPVQLPPVIESDALPKILFFSLIVLVVAFVFLATVAIISPHLVSYPGDPLGDRLTSFLASFGFMVIALGLSGGALAVYRKYIRRKND
ncbi:MAG: toll/interleukin-1 receptor domain-containing protein [Pyrinomonadaceae bacterium]